MKQRIFSAILALCVCFFSQSTVYARQEEPLRQEGAPSGEPAFGPFARDAVVPTPTEVYQAMIALQDQDAYKEGTTWTNESPYPNLTGDYYRWDGGPLDGANIVAVGCVAFAFILSDAAFGSLQARMYAAGEFSYADIKIGDILRVNQDTHTVIVLEVSDVGVVVAEGNNSTGDHKGKVHWGRAISKEEVMSSTSHYITRYPENYVAPDDPTANEIIGTGTLEGGITWNLTKAGTMTISGNGAMPDFESAENQPWSDKAGQIRKVIIEEGVTNIGSCAFWGCKVLSVEISSSVTVIGNSAFRESSIISVTVPSNVKTIGDSAFHSCQGLSAVTISEGVETVGQNAFQSCASLNAIELPSSITEVGSAAFFQCQALKSTKFAAGSRLVKMGDNLFTQCYYLTSVTLPKSIDRIGVGMFQNCLMLAGVEIPQGAESIEASAFASCSCFTTVVIPDSVKKIDIAAFSACPLTDIYFTGTEAQWNQINKIGDTAAAVSKATIHYNYAPAPSPDPGTGDGDHSGGNDSTGGSTGGDSTGPSTGGSTGGGGSTGPSTGGSTGGGDSSGGSTGGSTGGNDSTGGAAGGNTGDSDSSGIGGDSEVGDKSDNDESSEDENQTPEQKPLVKGASFSVGEATFKVTKAGKEVELTTIDSTAANLTVNTVTGTDGVKYKVTSIGAGAAQNNKKLTGLTIGANVRTIGADAFNGCTKLTKVTIGKNVVAIGARAFSGCKKLSKVTIQSTKLRSVGKQAFKGTKSSLKVKVPSKQLENYRKLFKKAGLKVKQVTK